MPRIGILGSPFAESWIKPRSELFKQTIIQLDSAAGEARENGLESLALHIEDTLIPFIESEQLSASLEEWGWSNEIRVSVNEHDSYHAGGFEGEAASKDGSNKLVALCLWRRN